MSDTTEIYLCKAGQALKEGRVEYSESITSKPAAEADAAARCAKDNTLAKIGYYSVNDDGDFHAIYTHNNPHAIGLGDAKPAVKVQLKKKKKAPKLSFWQRLFGKSGKKKKKA